MVDFGVTMVVDIVVDGNEYTAEVIMANSGRTNVNIEYECMVLVEVKISFSE